jgi:hypothetical protein
MLRTQTEQKKTKKNEFKKVEIHCPKRCHFEQPQTREITAAKNHRDSFINIADLSCFKPLTAPGPAQRLHKLDSLVVLAMSTFGPIKSA